MAKLKFTESIFIVVFSLTDLYICVMYYVFLVSTLVLWEGVLSTKTIKLHGNEKLVVAVPTSDEPRQEPIVRVKARDLDKVQVVPYVSNADTNISKESYDGRSEALDQHNSEEAITTRWHGKQDPNHSNFKKRNKESHRGAGYDKTHGPISEQNPLKHAHITIQDQECNNDHNCEVSRSNPLRQRGFQTSTDKYSCQEALRREPYCIAMLRRAKFCNAQDNTRRRHVTRDPIDQSRFRQEYHDQVYNRQGKRHSDSKRGHYMWRRRTRVDHDPVSNSHAHHYSKSRRDHQHSKGKERAYHDYVRETHTPRHSKSRRDFGRSKSKSVYR